VTRRIALGSAAAAAVAALATPPAADAADATATTASGPPVPPPERPLFGAQLWRLPNGLTVAFVESRRAPVVAQYLFYGAGGGEDPPGRSGVAHFLEHMMFKGSRNVPSGAFSQRIAREGGNDNAFTSRDVTAYHQHVEASRLPLIMGMEADRFAAPALGAEEFESERQVILEERRSRTDSSPRARFYEAFGAALWGPQHWHGRPIIGWEDEIRAIGLEDLRGFYARWYAPENAVLVVAGDVRESEFRRLAEEHYGAVPHRDAPRRDRAPAPPAAHEPRLIRRDPGVREAAFARAWMAPTLTAGETRHAYALEVLAHLLGGGQGSRLHRALVETGIAVSAGSGYDGDSLGAGSFSLYATPRREVAPDRLESAAGDVLKRLLDDGPTEAEVARSIRQMTAGALLALDSLGTAPRMLGGTLAIGLPIEAVEFWPARLRAVTRDQVAEAARAVLPATAPNTVGWLLPADAPAGSVRG
jgi:zinc protease